MSDEVLRDFLQPLLAEVESSGEFTLDPVSALRKLAQSQLPSPGLWPVKLVQGAVARGVEEVEIRQSATQIQLAFRGGRQASALLLLEELLGGKMSSDRSDNHLVTGLRGAYGRGLVSLSWVSTDEDHEERVQLVDGEISSEKVPRAGPSRFQLVVIAIHPKTHWSKALPSADEYKTLCEACRLCPIRVTVDSRLISRRPPETFATEVGRLVWVVDPVPGAPSLEIFPLDKESAAKKLMARRLPEESPCRGSMLIAASGVDSDATVKWISVHWLCDGALVGPYCIAGDFGPLRAEVVLPGDGLKTDLTGWAIRQAENVFPADTVLAAFREINDLLEERYPPASWSAAMLSGIKDTAIWLLVNGPVITLTLGVGVVPDPFDRSKKRTSRANLLIGFKKASSAVALRLSQAADEAVDK